MAKSQTAWWSSAPDAFFRRVSSLTILRIDNLWIDNLWIDNLWIDDLWIDDLDMATARRLLDHQY